MKMMLQGPRTDNEYLLAFAQTRDEQLRTLLVERYLPLARSIARRYAGRAEPLDDLVQVASLGLVKAIDRFDPSRGVAFSSFAVPTIAGEIRRHFRDRCWAVRPPRDLQDRALAVDRHAKELTDRLGHSPTIRQIGQALELSDEDVLEAMEAVRAMSATSLSVSRGADDDGENTLEASIGVEDDGFATAEQRVTYQQLAQFLTVREREVIRLRFELDLTQEEIGERVGVSQMQVSRVLRQALSKLTAVAAGA